ncbi:MAG: FkbM family methyltransferase [Rhodobacteraceae bacterium]|nr:FkbM family methyltransferase [Paracoccaceae bacterium]
MGEAHEPVADAAMDRKLREIWRSFDKPWMRRRLRALLPPTRVRAMGCDFIVHPRDNYTEFMIWQNGVPPEAEATQALIGRLAGRDAVIVDVGANAGAFCLPVLRACGAGSRVVAFEPNPVMRARLDVNIALNGFENVEVLDCAVGDAPGRSELFYPRNGNLGQGRVSLRYDRPGATGVAVDVRPLATCLREVGAARIDLLKVDVEGLEDRVICPFLQSDAPRPRMIYFEVAHDGTWRLPLLETLVRCGYVRAADFGDNALYEWRG